jgi:hypothetical protein
MTAHPFRLVVLCPTSVSPIPRPGLDQEDTTPKLTPGDAGRSEDGDSSTYG